MEHPFIKKWKPRRNYYLTRRHKYASDESKKPSPMVNNRCESVEYVIRQIEEIQYDMTTSYRHWRDMGFAFASEFRESGRNYFHRISRFHPDYDPEECDQQYDKCLRGKMSGITIGSFYFFAKQMGMVIPKRE